MVSRGAMPISNSATVRALQHTARHGTAQGLRAVAALAAVMLSVCRCNAQRFPSSARTRRAAAGPRTEATTQAVRRLPRHRPSSPSAAGRPSAGTARRRARARGHPLAGARAQRWRAAAPKRPSGHRAAPHPPSLRGPGCGSLTPPTPGVLVPPSGGAESQSAGGCRVRNDQRERPF